MKAPILIMILFGVLLTLVGLFFLYLGFVVIGGSGFNDSFAIGLVSFFVGIGLLAVSVINSKSISRNTLNHEKESECNCCKCSNCSLEHDHWSHD